VKLKVTADCYQNIKSGIRDSPNLNLYIQQHFSKAASVESNSAEFELRVSQGGSIPQTGQPVEWAQSEVTIPVAY